ncbi:S-layer protein [Methanococcus aeolicus]|uniref:S-layer protein n=1 Tax=Methanococcus aeolicus TaxID=42879 RepID=UPI0021C7FB02|nr:S-layer protein [Methanococcus aeolicus]UXM85243.1 S-layer protein [Methanococcus aeolicus]
MKKLILLLLCISLASNYAIDAINPVIIVNKDSPDANYANILMNEIYSYRNVKIIDGNIANIIENIYYSIPSTGEFNINTDNGIIYAKFNIENDNNIKYKQIKYSEILNSPKINENVNFLGNEYTVLDCNNDEIILSKEIKNITTNESFEYNGYTIRLKAISMDNSELLIDILKDNNSIDSNVKIHINELYTVKNSNLSIYYDNITKYTKEYGFSFKLYDSIKLVDGESFVLDNNYGVHIDNNEITLEYRNPEDIQTNFEIMNYKLKSVNIKNGIAIFNILYNNNYEINKDTVDGTKHIGNNLYLLKKDDKLTIYKNGKEYQNLTDYFGSEVAVDGGELLKTKSDLILIGGPVSNNATKKIENLLKISITNENPGANTGIIQKIENPYNPEYNIFVLAGSDRFGTKAAVLAVSEGLYKNEDTMIVKLNNDNTITKINN